MVFRRSDRVALLGALIVMSIMQGCDSSSEAGAGNTNQRDSDSVMTAGGLPLEGAINIDLGYKLNVVSGEYVHRNVQGLLFSDGLVFKDIPTLHLDDFDVEASRVEDPHKWGDWKREGDAVAIRWNNKDGVPGDWNTYEKWFMFESPVAGETLEGTYEKLGVASSSTGSREFFASSWKVVAFKGDGTFSESRGGGVTTGAGDNADADGILSISTGNSDSAKGKYQITDNGIQFTFDDGSKRENSIFFSSSEKKIILINGVKFIRG
jgi:hypothetical protein